LKAKKRFGQHFLRDNGIIHKIIMNLNPKPTDCLIEIGPGLGALTKPLLQAAQQLQVIEIDSDVIPTLEQLGSGLTIHQQDALTLDLTLFSQTPHNIRLVGNLPYNISSPLLFHALEYAELIDDMHFMLQKEVVDRICAKPGNKDYGRLSVMMQYFCETEWLFDVNPACFAPPPKVMSAVLRLKPFHEKPFVAVDEKRFAEVVRMAFSQRRKTLRNTLKGYVDAEGWVKLGIDPALRAEQLTVDDFVRIANLCSE
jgi:16S rRNA (adenine1518-N6/adenine1519-N6)-dimethyltransferase